MGFGDAFVNAYNATSATIENKKRTAIEEAKEKRAQTDWQEVHDATLAAAQMLDDHINQSTADARSKDAAYTAQNAANVPPPQAQGVQPPTSPDPSVAAPPPPPAAPRTQAVARNVSAQPGGGWQPGMPLPPAAPPGSSVKTTSEGVPYMADASGRPLSGYGPGGAPAGFVPAKGPIGNEPAPADVTAATPPPSAAAAPAAGPAAPSGEPPLAKRAAITPPGEGPPAPDKFVGTSGDVNAQIDRARDFTNKYSKHLFTIIAKTHPEQAAEYIKSLSNPAMKDQMDKTVAFAQIANADSSNPALQQMLTAVIPNAKPGSWLPRPPDAQGNQYAQYTEIQPDGSEVERPVNSATIKAKLMSTLSPANLLGAVRADQEQKLKEKEIAAQTENWKDARAHAWASLDEQRREHVAGDADRASMIDYRKKMGEATIADREDRQAESKDRRRALQADTAVKTLTTLNAIDPKTADPDTLNKFADHVGYVNTMLDGNNIETTPQSVQRMDAVVKRIRSGAKGSVFQDKDGDYFYNTGDPAKPIKVPPTVLQGLKLVPVPQPKAAPQPPPNRGLQQPQPAMMQ